MPKERGFQKNQRLLTKTSIHQVLKKGLRKRGPYFNLFFVRHNEERSRLGIIVSKRNVRLAVKRNAIKRLIREYFRLHDIKKMDVVIVAQLMKNASKRELHQCLESLFMQVSN